MFGKSLQDSDSNSKRIWIVSLLFLLSGLSSLIYQVIWTRMLVFVFGSTTFATSTVLSVFMGGLALGSYLASRYADKSKNPFLAYGILEGIIGFWALLAPLLFSLAVPIYQMFFDSLHLQVIPFGLLRFCVAALILGPPTACMGATLPLLSRFVTDSLDSVGDRVGRLYAINTLGAVLGSLAGGFLLLPELGLTKTIIIAASINILLAIAVYGLAKKWSTLREKTSAVPDEEQSSTILPETDSEKKVSKATLAVMIAFAISGALAMVYEVAWTRTLLLVIGSTTYAFTIMLSTFLVGIFLGSYFCARVADRLKNPFLWFALSEILLCLAGFVSLALFNYLPYVNLVVAHDYGSYPGINMLFRFLGAASVLVPITICLGAIFPLVVKVCARDLSKIGSSVGKLYSINTIGAIIGAFLAGFFIIPALGTEQTLVVTSAANLVLGVVLLLCFAEMRSSIKGFSALATIVIVIWAMQGPKFWDYELVVAAQPERRQFILGTDIPMPSFREWQEKVHSGHETLFCKEGLCACVTIHKSKTEPPVITLRTSGHVDASDAVDMENQAIIAIYPLMLKPKAEDICVVGWGSGVTAGYAMRFPIGKMVCAEIEPVVVETSKFFHHVNFKPEFDKRSVLEPADGRNYLLGTSQKFDAIISEPSNPWQAGVCNLFTREYFKICREKLKDNGIFTLWCQIQELTPKNIAQVFASLREEFPCIFLMRSGNGNVATLAYKDPNQKLSYKQIKETLELAEVRKSIDRFEIRTPEDFFARVVSCPSGVDKAIEGSYLNTDDTNYLEYDIAKSYETQLHFKENCRWLLKNSGPIWDYIDWGPISTDEKALVYARVAKSCLELETGRAFLWANESLRLKSNPDAFYVIAQAQILQRQFEEAGKTLAEAKKRFASDGRFLGLEGSIALKFGDYANARSLLSKSLSLDPKNNLFRYALAVTYSPLDVSELLGLYMAPSDPAPAKVVELLAGQLENDPQFNQSKPGAVAVLADAYNRLGKYNEAISVLDKALRKAPDKQLYWRLIAESYAGLKDWRRSAFCWNKAYEVVSQQVPFVLQRTRKLIAEKKDLEALRQIQALLEIAPANPELNQIFLEYARKNQAAAELYSRWLADTRSKSSSAP